MDTVKKKKNRNSAVKTAPKRVIQKTAEATEDLIGDEIEHKITSLGNIKSKERKMKDKKSTYHQKTDSKLLMT